MAFKLNLDSETFLSKKFLIPTGIVVALLFIIMLIIGLNSNKTSPYESVARLNLRTTNLTKTIKEYNKYIGSSSLRSLSSSLNNFLVSITTPLKNIVKTSEYKEDMDKETLAPITTEETDHINSLNSTLTAARYNASLDAVYAREMGQQILQLVELEQAVKDNPDIPDDALKSALDANINNLNSLYPQFRDFSG